MQRPREGQFVQNLLPNGNSSGSGRPLKEAERVLISCPCPEFARPEPLARPPLPQGFGTPAGPGSGTTVLLADLMRKDERTQLSSLATSWPSSWRCGLPDMTAEMRPTHQIQWLPHAGAFHRPVGVSSPKNLALAGGWKTPCEGTGCFKEGRVEDVLDDGRFWLVDGCHGNCR